MSRLTLDGTVAPTRCCVNPDHLDVVTHRENIARKSYPVTCPHGHAVFVVRRGKRVCVTCDRERNTRLYREKHPAVHRTGRRWLSAEEKAQIVALIEAGKSHSQIARIVGTSIGTVSRVRNAHA